MRGIGLAFATVLGNEVFFRAFRNRREVSGYLGLAPSPWQSGGVRRDQGIAKSGNPRARRTAIELAWLWLRHQPGSALARWNALPSRLRLMGIVAVAVAALVGLTSWAMTSVFVDYQVLFSNISAEDAGAVVDALRAGRVPHRLGEGGQVLVPASQVHEWRLKLASQMAEKGDVYVLDEPTTGLHLADVEQLLGLLDRLVDSGKSVLVITHHQAVMARADWIIDLGPGAGHDGGRIVFEGTPAELVAFRSTLTGEHLAAYVA